MTKKELLEKLAGMPDDLEILAQVDSNEICQDYTDSIMRINNVYLCPYYVVGDFFYTDKDEALKEINEYAENEEDAEKELEKAYRGERIILDIVG